MQHEASNELIGVKLHGFVPIVPFSPVILISKGHLLIVFNTTTGHNAVHIRVLYHRRAPSVQYHSGADLRPQMFCIICNDT